MELHSLVNRVCLGIAITCLVLAFLLAGYWLILVAFLLMILIWIRFRNKPVFYSASSLLLVYVLLSVVGIFANLSTWLLVLGCTAALACWDLTIFGDGIKDNTSMGGGLKLEQHHLKSLAAVVSTGLVSASMSSFIKLNLPFIAVVFLVLLGVGCFTYSLSVGRR